MRVPSFMLKKLYVDDSLEAREEGGFAFRLQNNLATATIVGPPEVEIDGAPKDIVFVMEEETIAADEVTEDDTFELEKGIEVRVESDDEIEEGAHKIQIVVETDEWDTLDFEVEDTI